jgi:signal peptidase I
MTIDRKYVYVYSKSAETMDRKKFDSVLAVAASAVALVTLMAATAFDVARVDGHSMEPTLLPGQVIFINRLAYGLQAPFFPGYLIRWSRPSSGEIIVFLDPVTGRFAVKRCATLGDGEAVYALGDNDRDSFDSRNYGMIPFREIRGKVIY